MTKPCLLLRFLPKERINDYIHQGNRDFDYETSEDIKNFFQSPYNATPPKQPDCHNDQGQASHCNLTICTPCDNESDTAAAANPPSCCSNDLPHDHNHCNIPCDASPPYVCHQCSFCNDIEWAKCKMQNPATGTQTSKDYNALHKANNHVHLLPCHCQSDSPPHCNGDSHSMYHVDNS